MILEFIPKEDWVKFSEGCYAEVFGQYRRSSLDRIDFAVGTTVDDRPVAYITCKEFDGETLYYQFGGRFPGASRILLVRFFEALNKWALSKYKKVFMLVERDNTPMIKLGFHTGFRIEGVTIYKDDCVLVQMSRYADG